MIRKSPPASPPGVDEHTTALWLFDESPYANVILTDAGPFQIDLRLETGVGKPLPEAMRAGRRGLVAGKFGNALHLPIGEGAGVTWPESHWLAGGKPFIFDRGDEVPERCNLGYIDFTLEFWFKADGEQAQRGVVWELRNEAFEWSAKGVNALFIEAGRSRFLMTSKLLSLWSWDMELEIPTDAAKLNDGEWHHLAFTFTSAECQMRHYVDGCLQALPQRGGFLPLASRLVSMRLGRDLEGGQELSGLLDELRISDVVRYNGDFTPPGSFSTNYGLQPPEAARPNGLPLLFAAPPQGEPLPLGSRKHVFVDGALLDRLEGLSLQPNPPVKIERTDFRCTRPWEPGPRMGPAIPDICSFWEEEGGEEIRMLYSNNGLYGGKRTAICLATSADGLHWEKPNLRQVAWDGSLENNIVLRNACQGTAFLDPNPGEPPDRRYKYVAWCMQRGFYVFTSPDGVHWRRNETLALPFDPDGSIEVYWDDQSGLYRGTSRALTTKDGMIHFRAIVRSQSREILKPWPFQPVPNPEWHCFAGPKPSSGELPFVETYGEVYRFKGIKYPWAPDVYLAFPWRYIRSQNIRPGSLMMVSRDGENWARYEPPYYFSAGWEWNGQRANEALIEQGMIRRGDEIWQYGTVRFTEHAGVLYGGVGHEVAYEDCLMRLTQRLDGFVSLSAGQAGGCAVTLPLRFEGQSLQLNAAAQGSIRVGLLDERGEPLPGFSAEECLPIRTDSVRHTVAWHKGAEVGNLAGRTVRLQFRLENAQIYAFQFIER